MTTPAPRQDGPDAADLATVLSRVRWPLRLTWAGLWAERIARRFWPLATLVMAGLTAQGFAVFDLLPIEAAWLLVLALALGLLAALVWGLRGFHRPSRAEALARLDATLPGQPLATLADHMAIGGGFVIGCVVLLAAWLVMRYTVVRLPLKPFFMFTGSFMYLMAFVFAGKGVLELVEGKLFQPTLMNGMPEFGWLGIYPYVETLVPQAVLLLAAVVALWVMRRRNHVSGATIKNNP